MDNIGQTPWMRLGLSEESATDFGAVAGGGTDTLTMITTPSNKIIRINEWSFNARCTTAPTANNTIEINYKIDSSIVLVEFFTLPALHDCLTKSYFRGMYIEAGKDLVVTVENNCTGGSITVIAALSYSTFNI